jgi:adenylate kinase family enzyme
MSLYPRNYHPTVVKEVFSNLALIASLNILTDVILETRLGHQVASILASGELVPDNLVVDLLLNELHKMPKEHVLLDGFPRTLRQAEILDQDLHAIKRPMNMVLNLDVPEDVIMARITGKDAQIRVNETRQSNWIVLHSIALLNSNGLH